MQANRPAIVSLLILTLLPGLMTTARAQDDTVDGWPLAGAVEPPPQSFVIAHGPGAQSADPQTASQAPLYRVRITVAPRFEVPDNGTYLVILDDRRVTREVLERRDPEDKDPGSAQWRREIAALDDPYMTVHAVRGVFDKGTVEAGGGNVYNHVLPIPTGATTLLRVEIDMEWAGHKRTLVFGEPPVPREYRPIGVAAPLIGFTLCGALWVRRRPRKEEEADVESEARRPVEAPDPGEQTDAH